MINQLQSHPSSRFLFDFCVILLGVNGKNGAVISQHYGVTLEVFHEDKAATAVWGFHSNIANVVEIFRNTISQEEPSF